MTVVLEQATEDRGQATDMLDEILTAHREALLELAPRQEERTARVEAAWHIDELGMLLRVRDGVQAAPADHPALAGLRAGQAARLRAAVAYRAAGGDPVKELTELMPLPLDMLGLSLEPEPEQESAAPGAMQGRERQREDTGTSRRRR